MGIMRIATASLRPARPPKARSQREVWQAFFSNAALLRKNQVTDEELEILHDFSPLGVVTCDGDILFILSTIRWARDKKPGS